MKKLKRYIFGFKKYSYLLRLRITHDIRAKYKNSFLGILWSLFNPLLQMIVMAIVFSTVFGRSNRKHAGLYHQRTLGLRLFF